MTTVKPKSKNNPSERVITSFVRALDRAYSNWWTLIARSFVAGMFTALGATVGLVLITYLLGLMFNKLGVLPVIGEFFAKLNELVSLALPGR